MSIEADDDNFIYLGLGDALEIYAAIFNLSTEQAASWDGPALFRPGEAAGDVTRGGSWTVPPSIRIVCADALPKEAPRPTGRGFRVVIGVPYRHRPTTET